jgi:hypothetical protein
MADVRKAKKQIEQRGHDFADTHLWWDGKDIVVRGPDGHVTSALRRPGQQMFHFVVLPLSEWASHIAEEAEPLPMSQAAFRRHDQGRQQLQLLNRVPTVAVVNP